MQTLRKHTGTLIALLLLSALVSGMVWQAVSSARAIVSAQDTSKISDSALRQIEALVNEKESRTTAQQKLDSQLLYAIKMHRSENIAAGVSKLEVKVDMDAQEKTVVDIAAMIDDALLETLRAVGGEIINSFPEYHSLRASIPLTQLETIAALPQVRFIQPKQKARFLRQVTRSGYLVDPATWPVLSPSFADRADRVRTRLSDALPRLTRGQNIGSKTSEGDTTHRAAAGRAMFGVNGAGVKIGVLSAGAASLTASQSSGNLPSNVTILPGQAGPSNDDEGTAMLEIIYDLAPGAQLFFATGNNGAASFAQNIRDLRAAGCDIIVDDIGYIAESPFQDGQAPGIVSSTFGSIIAQAVNDVTADGALYFSAGGNDGNKKNGTATVWQGDFVDGGASPLSQLAGGTVNDFGSGQTGGLITPPSRVLSEPSSPSFQRT